jgi:hypothetical protein
MEELTIAERQYLKHKQHSKASYEKKMGPKENRRPRGRPRKLIKTDSVGTEVRQDLPVEIGV